VGQVAARWVVGWLGGCFGGCAPNQHTYVYLSIYRSIYLSIYLSISTTTSIYICLYLSIWLVRWVSGREGVGWGRSQRERGKRKREGQSERGREGGCWGRRDPFQGSGFRVQGPGLRAWGTDPFQVPVRRWPASLTFSMIKRSACAIACGGPCEREPALSRKDKARPSKSEIQTLHQGPPPLPAAHPPGLGCRVSSKGFGVWGVPRG